jgi:hypothetical protein
MWDAYRVSSIPSQVFQVDAMRTSRDEDLKLRLVEEGETDRADDAVEPTHAGLSLRPDAIVNVMFCHQMDITVSANHTI